MRPLGYRGAERPAEDDGPGETGEEVVRDEISLGDALRRRARRILTGGHCIQYCGSGGEQLTCSCRCWVLTLKGWPKSQQKKRANASRAKSRALPSVRSGSE